MKKNFETLTLVIPIFILIVFLSFLLISHKNNYFNKIEFEKNNKVKNETNINYLDTIVHSGLKVLNIDTINITLRHMPFFEIDDYFNDDIDYYSLITDNNNAYILYTKYMNREQYIPIISHALLHLNQYNSKRLIKPVENGIMIWDGKKIYLSDYKYREYPWENEVLLRERDVADSMRMILYNKR